MQKISVLIERTEKKPFQSVLESNMLLVINQLNFIKVKLEFIHSNHHFRFLSEDKASSAKPCARHTLYWGASPGSEGRAPLGGPRWCWEGRALGMSQFLSPR